MSTYGKPLRFAALIRVSTEKQERQGESLRTQADQIARAVEALGGKLVKTFAGQEHATAGWERQQLNELLADAKRPDKPFDAVIVADPSRWSRDNVASETGLEVIRGAGVKFFVLTAEYDLFDPNARLFLGLSSTIGAFAARTQKQKSLLNKIARAKRGIPTAGKVPFARVWNREKQGWDIDSAKQTMIRDVAERYLLGESLPKLAKEYGQNHSNLCKVLRERCGDEWIIEFRADDLNIHEEVAIKVPALLPDKTIKAIRFRLEANRTFLHRPPISKYDWLLAGHLFCAECGYSFFGQVNHNGRRYYRHGHLNGARACPLDPKPWVPADKVEEEIVGQLFDLFGNPQAIERAVKRAIPDCDKITKHRDRLAAEVDKVDRARNRVLDLIEKDALTTAQAEKKLAELKEREAALREELDKYRNILADLPNEAELSGYVEKLQDTIFVFDGEGNRIAGGNTVSSFIAMTRDDRRKLISAVFDARQADGRPAGVYVTRTGDAKPHRPKHFSLQIRGLLPFELVVPSSSASRDTIPPECRSCVRTRQPSA